MSKSISDHLVICDVDGTLLKAGYGVPAENIEAIEEFTARGGLFSVCTDRNLEDIKRLSDWININAPVILDNGTYIYDLAKKEVLYDEALLMPEAGEVLKGILDMYPELGVEITSEPRVYVPCMNKAVDEHTSLLHLSYRLAPLDEIPETWHKIVLCGDEKTALSARNYAYLQENVDESFTEFDYVITSPGVMQIIPRNDPKGAALKTLCQECGIDREDTIAIGNDLNDRGLLKAAGISAAVADAAVELRNISDMVVSYCLRGGVADLLRRFDDIAGDYEQTEFEL